MSNYNLKSDHNSRPRNPIIANACFLAGYIDTWGRGTLKIIHSCIEAGLPEPEITEKNGGVEVTVFNLQQPEHSERIRNDFGKNSERIRNEFGNGIAIAFEIIKNHPEFTSQQIAKEISKTPRTVEKYLSKLKNAELIVRKGPKLGGHWEITEGK